MIQKKVISDARKPALDALCDVIIGGAYAGQAIGRRLRDCGATPEDKRLATGIFYTALENRILINHIINQFVKHIPEPVVGEILSIAVAQLLFMDKIPDHAAVDQAVRQVRRLGREGIVPLVNGSLRTIIRARDDGTISYPSKEENLVRYLSIMYSMSEPLVAKIIDAYGQDEAEAIIMYKPSERWESIRPNVERFDAPKFEGYLSRRGWEYKQGPVPMNWYVRRAGDLTADFDYKAGMFSVQGAASMLAAYAVEAQPGMHILDACAAPGGKSALMCEIMQGTGRVFAYDVHEHRVALIKAAEKRLRLNNLRAVVCDASIYRPDREMTMDAVLVDAPCSGLGVIANKTDIKLRYSDDNTQSLVDLQRKLLDTCSRYVKPGALLVYATCTILPEENENQVQAFLKRNRAFSLDTCDTWIPTAYRHLFSNGMLKLMPHRDEMDGFFVARMRRMGND